MPTMCQALCQMPHVLLSHLAGCLSNEAPDWAPRGMDLLLSPDKDEAQPRRVCPRAWVWAGQEDGRKVVEGQMLENTGQE